MPVDFRLKEGVYLTDEKVLYRVMSIHTNHVRGARTASVSAEDSAHPGAEPHHYFQEREAMAMRLVTPATDKEVDDWREARALCAT